MSRWFSYNQRDGMKIFNTMREARAAAEESLSLERNEAPEGWSEEVTEICWGAIKERVMLTNSKPALEDEPFDIWEDYELKKI